LLSGLSTEWTVYGASVNPNLLQAHDSMAAAILGRAQERLDLGQDPYPFLKEADAPLTRLPGRPGSPGQTHRLGCLTGLLWGGLARIFLVHHVTWSINSVCHMFGERTYRTRDESGVVPGRDPPAQGRAPYGPVR